MSAVAARRRISYAEYLASESTSEVRHEYIDGEILAMAGGTPTHALLCTNAAVALGGALRGRPCRPYSADLRVRIPDTGLATYPDVSVICGTLVTGEPDLDAATNPTVLVEVLSPSTEAYDRGEKFAHYRRLPSLQEYVLVAQDRVRVEHYRRNADDSWTLRELGAGHALRLDSIDAALAIDDLYEDWAPPRKDPPPAE